MLRSPSSTPASSACALSPPDTPSEGAARKNEGFGKSYQHYLADQGSARTPYQAQRPRKQNDQQQQPDYNVNNDWRSGSYDSSNTSWESDWSTSRGAGTTTIKSESPSTTAFYKYRNTTAATGSYQASGAAADWSSGDPPTPYGVMQQQQQQSSSSSPSASSSYYDSNDYYGGYGYGGDQHHQNNARGSSGYQQQQQYNTQYPGGGGSSYNGNRNPSSCPPAPGKQQDYQRRQTRYGMDTVLRTQIKREPDPDGVEMEGENFTSLFTKSLTSLYSQDTENAFGEDSKTYDSDIMICNPSGSLSPVEDGNYHRLGPPQQGQYNTGYQNMRNNFGFYENRQSNCEPSVVQELGSGQERTNSFRYDRPSFDDMHLYASSPPESKSQAKKRKLSMPNIAPEGGNYSGTDGRRKGPRMMSFKSESKWTPNSFAFGDVQIKQEPIDDYTTEDLDSQNRNMIPFKDTSPGTSNGNKSSGQSEHTKAPPRKRSPGSTCFDRFEKKSTPTSKKVSPLSVYAKVQDSVVLNVKCRRYKKRTKAITTKEEIVYPGKEEIENWKRTGAYSESPDQAVRHLMGDLLERVSQYGSRTVDVGPDLSKVDSLKLRELVFQFCQRYSLDYRDFEDIESVLTPTIVNDKTAKNSLRASAIRKRTSDSPARQKQAPEPETRPPKTEKAVKKSSSDAPSKQTSERRVLRNLPGRVDRGRQQRRRSGKTPVVRRRYSTRSAKDAEETNHSDVDIIIDSSTDRESEAGKEAEVRKKSQRLKNKLPPVETPAKENNKPPTKVARNNSVKREEPRTRSREKKETEKMKDIARTMPKKKWSRLHISSSENSQSSSGDSIEIIDNSLSSPKLLGKETKLSIKIEPLESLKSLTTIKASEKPSNKTSKQSDDSSSRNSRATEDSNCKVVKQTEETISRSKSTEESTLKNSKSKDVSIKSGIKNEESFNSRVILRKLSQKTISQPASKKEHIIGRPRRSIEQPIYIEDSTDSKDDDESSSKISDQKTRKEALKNSDTSSDESKDSVAELLKEKSVDRKLSKIPVSDASIKISKQKAESDVSDSASNETRDPKRNESISSKSDKSSEIINCRVQNLDKPIKFSLLNERNESTLQIKLNRLPLKLDSKKRLLPLENQDFYCSMIKSKDDSPSSNVEEKKDDKDNDNDLQNPPQLVCMKEPVKETADDKSADDTRSPDIPDLPPERKTESPTNLVSHTTEPSVNTTENGPSKEDVAVGKPCPIIRPRYSESEDSDCGLVIDLDRRLSVEERVPSPTFQNAAEKKSESIEPAITMDLVVKKEPDSSPRAETKSPPITIPKRQMDDDCILLPPSEDSLHLDSRSARFFESTAKSFSLVDSDLEHAKKMKDQEESILRTLLLETADAASGVGQDLLSQNHCDASSDISADSKASISQDVMKLLMYQTYHEVSPCSPGFDDKKIPIDQLTSDVNAQLLSDEECLRDPRLLKERIKKLKNEIVYLQCMIDQKDKERTAIICFKKYKEEVLKRVLKEYASNVQDHVRDWIRSRQESNASDSRSSSSGRQASIASTSSSSSSHPSLPSDSPHPQLSPAHQVIQLAYHATVKTDVPTSTVTSASKKPSQCNESLPTVATMIAKATENYGVDMRTMRNSTSTTQTILQKVLSSKEAIYSPTACRSPSSDKSSGSKSTSHQQQSVQIFQKTLSSSTRESCFSPVGRKSPSLPDLRPGVSKSGSTSQLLHKALSGKDSSPAPSRSPPSLQPELRPVKSSNSPSSLIQKHPLDLIVNSTEKLKSSSSSKSFEPVAASHSKVSHESSTKHNPSPKRSSSTSYSAWSSVHSRTSLSATTTTTIDLRTDHTRTTQEPTLSLSKRSHNSGHSSSGHSSSGQGFMVVPPPTTLQQSQKSSMGHQSRSESTHPHEKSLKTSVERIYSRKTEEERRTMSFSSSVMATGNPLQFSHPHKTLPAATASNSISVGSSKVIAQPTVAPPTTSPPRCMGCGLSHAKFLCSGCRSHWYCSPECQSMRWPEHSQTCVGNVGRYSQSPGPSYS